MVNQKYTKADRLRKTCDYSHLSKCGKKYFSDHFIIIAKINNKFRSRLGVTVSKKVGNAVTRNRLKRIVREYFRLHIKKTLKYHDINIIAKKGLGDLRSDEVFRTLTQAFNYMASKRIPLIRDRAK